MTRLAALKAIADALDAVPPEVQMAVTEAAVGLVVDAIRGKGVVRAAKLRAMRAAFNAATDTFLTERAKRLQEKP